MISDVQRSTLFRLLRVCETDPRRGCYELFADPDSPSGRLELTTYQADVIRSVLRREDVTWRSGHGCGKTTTLAILVILFLLLRPRSKVGTTAPTWRQVRTLWYEIRKWVDRFQLSFLFDPLTTELRVKAAPAEWFAEGVASNRPTNIEGKHGPAGRFLFVADEAKGIADGIFDSIDGACSDGGTRVYTSTPGSRAGRFYLSHHGRVSKFFKVFHTSGEDSPRVGRAWLEQKREEWGERSPIYIAKVRGDFPQEGDDVMFPLDYVDEAERAYMETVDNIALEDGGEPAVGHPKGAGLSMGLDVSRFGFDKTVLFGGSLRRVDRLESWERTGIPGTASRAFALARQWEAEMGEALRVIAVDDTGLGGGVTDILRLSDESGGRPLPVEAVLFGGAPTVSSDGIRYFANKKAEIADALRRTLEDNVKARKGGAPGTFALMSHDRLKGQLTSIRRRYIQKGVLALVDPDDPSIPREELAPGMKVSPDHAHALILQHYAAAQAVALTTSYSYVSDEAEDDRERRAEMFRPRGRFGSSIFGTGRGGE